MSKVIPNELHTIKDIWEAYATQLLKDNPDYFGRFSDKIKNFYIYRKGTPYRSTVVWNRPVKAFSRSGLVICYTDFRKIIEQYLLHARLAIIQGEAVDLMSFLGKLCARRVERNFRTQRKIDWGASKKYRRVDPVTGKVKYARVVRVTTDDWCRIGWHKTAKIKNEYFYEFMPSEGSREGSLGFKQLFSGALNRDPLLKYRYLYAPLKPKKVKEEVAA